LALCRNKSLTISTSLTPSCLGWYSSSFQLTVVQTYNNPPFQTSSSSNRFSTVLPLDNGLGTETARYARENAIKEIHDNFMKGYKDTNDKINNRNVDEQVRIERIFFVGEKIENIETKTNI
jgi:hypothetical protein